MSKRSRRPKPAGYWTLENIKKEMIKVINEIGHFPTTNELREMDRGDLESAVSRHTEGLVWLRDNIDKTHENKIGKEGHVTAKKIVNLMTKLRISELNLKNERELELAVWGLFCGRWENLLKYQREVNGRLCDIVVDEVAVEIKDIKGMRDKDRCIGQIMDYLKSKDEVVVIARDPKGYLQGLFRDDARISIFRV